MKNDLQNLTKSTKNFNKGLVFIFIFISSHDMLVSMTWSLARELVMTFKTKVNYISLIVKCLQQKIVIKVTMYSQKLRSKAMKIAVGVSGNKIH